MTSPIVFLDTETTGLHADRRAWEIAMIRRADGHDSAVTLQVTDVDLSSAELKGLQIGGFYERHHQAAPAADYKFAPLNPKHPYMGRTDIDAFVGTEADVAKVVEQVTRGADIVGVVPNFDTETLAAMLRRHALCPSWNYHLIDVVPLAAGWLLGAAEVSMCASDDAGEPHSETAKARLAAAELPWKSDDLSRAVGIDPPSEEYRHTAMGDADWAKRLFDRITGNNW
ncbi:hypothetical protein NONO_c60010 [Nocardia nova SH22a]|uniref:Exonuclease n=1 Tax=Nocardia nova SH22a TaxID=1415166 RepID=W5TNE0_9NOCA|nr:hypothetical protein [Nocardia nova]AHH20777.1 hypothetical protein NONO_c60010 [Nocardia nova SH22a]